MNIIFFGTPQFAVIILRKLIESGMRPRAVVTAPDRPSGRGQNLTSPPVKACAKKYGIPVLQPEKANDGAFLQNLHSYNADVFVIAAYGKILPKTLLNIPPFGIINVHPSLLPAYRGPSPIQTAIINGETHTGVTLMLTDEYMDHGPIISNIKFQIADFPAEADSSRAEKITYMQLHDKLAEIGGNLLVETLPKWVAGEITPRDQEHGKATYTKLLTKEDGHIDWSKPAEEIDRMVRAYTPWPGAWSFFSESPASGKKRVKILAGHPTKDPTPAPPGTIIKIKNGRGAAVCTGTTLYALLLVQIEGKKPSIWDASAPAYRFE